MAIVSLGLIVASLLLLWGYVRFRMRRMVELAEKIPGPKPLPLIGNVMEMGTSPSDIFGNMVRLYQQFGPIGRFWFGPVLAVAVSDPKYIEIILSTNRALDKAWNYKLLHPWLGEGLLTGTGQRWRTHRKLITPAFHFKILEKFVDVFNANSEILLKQLSAHVGGPEFDIYSYITLCALDNICETAMGVNVNAQLDYNSEYVKATRSMLNIFMQRNLRPWLHPDFIFKMSSLGKEQARNLQVLHGLTTSVIQAKRKEFLQNPELQHSLVNDLGMKKRIPFLDLLMQESQDGISLTDEEIREEVDTIMFEGHDTVSSALSFTCYMLANHQEIQEKAVTELKDIFGESERLPTHHDIHEMKYLEQVIKETLRMFPSVPIFGRYITEELDIGDYILPAGANVVVGAIATHFDERYFSDPMTFNPDRFLSDSFQNRHPYTYLPFAAGQRNCIGQKYAMLELKSTLCQILRTYRLLPGDTPIELGMEVVLKSTNGINVKLQSRNKLMNKHEHISPSVSNASFD